MLRANTDAVLGDFQGVSDLNAGVPIWQPSSFGIAGGTDEHRQDIVCPSHGLPAGETFHRIVQRYQGDYRARSRTCAEQFRVLAFAQLTYRESLRDIEVCLSAQSSKLYHMGIREPIRRSTLADANENRNWCIYADFAQVLITQARRLYAQDSFGVDLSNTVYALDSTTIDLCLSML